MRKISDVAFDYSVDALLSGRVELVTKQLFDTYSAAVETQLADLVSSGTAISRIGLGTHPDGKTVITVDRVPGAEFSIHYADDAPTCER